MLAARTRREVGAVLNAVAEFEVDVRPADGSESFHAVIGEVSGADFWPPREGDIVRVLVDIKRKRAKFDKTDPAISYRAHKAATGEAQTKALSGGPVEYPLPEPTAEQLAQLNDPAIRLKRLEELHDQGLVTDAEYAVQRLRITGSAT